MGLHCVDEENFTFLRFTVTGNVDWSIRVYCIIIIIIIIIINIVCLRNMSISTLHKGDDDDDDDDDNKGKGKVIPSQARCGSEGG